ncbi:hypothetical protein K491DRAFT_722329 [Lophiostoma macrostomum CBS 122681]|uniref:Alcohol acetyltransferase n=1 Tax=Lophiostoma macrostomum CBS 122681 TaxID=1314788 RepID=A0A6A6SRE3_9PLEO|nr:hypothetical protein K491DRAFT_722329 [Lophiostoma macrostomum CBS 122681]
MDISQLKKLRAAGKQEEMAALAHALDLYTTPGLSVHYKTTQALSIPSLETLIYQACAQVLRGLPTLFVVPVVVEGAQTYFARLPTIDLRKVTTFLQRQNSIPDDGSGRDSELDALLQEQVNTNYKSDQGILPVWRLVVLYDFTDRQQFTATFMVHHGIADGASMQMVQREFHKALHNLSSSQPAPESQVEYIIPSSDDDGIGPPLESLHSLPILEEVPPTDAPKYKDWIGKLPEVPSKTGWATLTLSPPMVQAFVQQCRKNKVGTPSGLNALIAKVVYSNLPSTTESLNINIPVDLRSDLPPKAVDGVMGNFWDTFQTRILRSDISKQDSSELGDIWAAARKVQSDTRKYMSRTAPSGELYLNVAGLKNIPDLQAFLKGMIGGPRVESLELTYIGPYAPYSDPKKGNELVWQAGRASICRCVFALGACLQMTGVMHPEGMTIGFAWPRGAIEEDLVDKTIEGIRNYFVSIS